MYNFDMYFFDMFRMFHPPCVFCKKMNHPTEKHQCSKCRAIGDHRSSLCSLGQSPNASKYESHPNKSTNTLFKLRI